MSRNDVLIPRYTGAYFIDDYDKLIEFINAYEFVHGQDKISGAFRSLLSFYDDAYAWREFFIDRCAKLEASIDELNKTPIKKTRKKNNE